MTEHDLVIVLDDLARAIDEEAAAVPRIANSTTIYSAEAETQRATLAAISRAIRKVVGDGQ